MLHGGAAPPCARQPPGRCSPSLSSARRRRPLLLHVLSSARRRSATAPLYALLGSPAAAPLLAGDLPAGEFFGPPGRCSSPRSPPPWLPASAALLLLASVAAHSGRGCSWMDLAAGKDGPRWGMVLVTSIFLQMASGETDWWPASSIQPWRCHHAPPTPRLPLHRRALPRACALDPHSTTLPPARSRRCRRPVNVAAAASCSTPLSGGIPSHSPSSRSQDVVCTATMLRSASSRSRSSAMPPDFHCSTRAAVCRPEAAMTVLNRHPQ